MNKLREIANKGEKSLGTFVELGGANVVEALGQTGLDFIIVDNEHGPFDVESSLECIRAAESSGLVPLCRVREIARPAILKLLDQGAAGLIVPYIETVEQVQKLIEFGKYAPVGKRGYSGSRKDRWCFGKPGELPLDQQMKYWNEETLLIPQCETVGCLEHIEEITALEGVDGIFVGPFDLSISMGMPGDFQNPKMIAAFERIIKACKAAGKLSIIFTAREDWIQDYYKMGFDMVTFGMDASVMVNGFKKLVADQK